MSDPEIIKLTWGQVERACEKLVRRHKATLRRIYGVPNGGIPVAAMLSGIGGFEIVENPLHAELIVDDLVDSGVTARRYRPTAGGPPTPQFDALFRKPHSPKDLAPSAVELNGWLEFPWERAVSEAPAEDAVRRILQAIGEKPGRDGLQDTPKRVVKSWSQLFGGYAMNPADVVKTFDVPEAGDELVLLRNIEIYSTCEHHMLPFHGRAHIAYIPKDAKHVLGVSKLARLMECFSRRLQVQERIGTQVTDFLMGEHVQAAAAACIIEAKHMCISSRGIQKQHSDMVTSSVKGAFREVPEARAELLQLIYGRS